MSDFIHATAVVVGEKGILILGESGAGKSALAERIIHEAQGKGLFAGLVGDDRIAVRKVGGRPVISGHPAISGQIERRGIGIFDIKSMPNAVLKGVVSITRDPPRLPDEAARTIALSGVSLPLLTLRDDRDLVAKAHLVLEWIDA